MTRFRSESYEYFRNFGVLVAKNRAYMAKTGESCVQQGVSLGSHAIVNRDGT